MQILHGGTMDAVTITRRSRNLGYGWNNTPGTMRLSNGGTTSYIPRPDHPGVQGGPRTIFEERHHAARINSGGVWWSEALFVGGRLVYENVDQVLWELREMGTTQVHLV